MAQRVLHHVSRAVLAVALSVCTRAADPPPPDWSPAVHEALAAYAAGRLDETLDVCRSLSESAPDAAARRDAEALAALTLMTHDERAQRATGRALLLNLAENHPETALLDRPECQLALGRAALGLHETSRAIEWLRKAAQGFQRQRRHRRGAAALTALAEAWAQHAEWELPIAGVEAPLPRNADEALRVRIDRIQALRTAAGALPESGDATDAIDLVLARLYLTDDARRDQAIPILERIAGGGRGLAAADAALLLAEQRERQNRWNEALALYERVARVGDPAQRRRANRRASELSRPQIRINLPEVVRPNTPLNLDIAARNLDVVRVELRRMDLASWLAEHHGRLPSAQLPESGSVLLAGEISTSTAEPSDWWREAGGEGLQAELPPGAYVLLTRGRRGEQTVVESRRLIVASSLDVAVITGARRGWLWINGGDDRPATAEFWMHGAFVPTQIDLDGDEALFDLPAEARLLRTSEWTCLVRCGEQIALCGGKLTEAAGGDAPPPVLLAGGPTHPTPGDTVRIFGRLLDPPADARSARKVSVALLDPLERVAARAESPLNDDGTFAAMFRVDRAWGDRSLRAVVRAGEQVLPDAASPLVFSVAPNDPPRFTARIVPLRDRFISPMLEGDVVAETPWGVALRDARVRLFATGVRLPTNEPFTPAQSSLILDRGGRARPDGRLPFAIPRADFELRDGPLAIELRASVEGWDNRTARSVLYLSPWNETPHLWLRPSAAQARVGDVVPIFVDWYDPTGRATAESPTVSVIRGDTRSVLRIHPSTAGFVADDWSPAEPGRYELRAELACTNNETITARAFIDVDPAGSGAAARPRLLWRTASNAHDAAALRVEHAGREPLAIVLSAADPLTAYLVPAEECAATIHIDRSRLAEQPTVASLWGWRDGALELLDQAPWPTDSQPTLWRVEPAGQPTPGARSTVHVELPDDTATDWTVAARLSSAPPATPWTPRAFPKPDPANASIAIGATSSVPVASRAVWPRVAMSLVSKLTGGETLWLDSRTHVSQRTAFRVPVPRVPGRYRLDVVAFAADGRTITQRLPFDTRRMASIDAAMAEEMIIGDRVSAGVTIRGGETRQDVRFEIDLGGGLALLDARFLDSPDRDLVEFTAGETQLTLEPGQQRNLLLRFEAIAAGRRRARFTIATSDGVRIATEARYLVRPAEEPAGEADVRIDRRVYVVTPVGRSAEPEAAPFTIANWLKTPEAFLDLERRELRSGETVPPGQLLLVADEVRTSTLLTNVRWRQSVAATCVTYRDAPNTLYRIGTPGTLETQAEEYTRLELPRGKHLHEFLMVPMALGAAQIPPPQVTASDSRVAVTVDRGDIRVLVSDPTR